MSVHWGIIAKENKPIESCSSLNNSQFGMNIEKISSFSFRIEEIFNFSIQSCIQITSEYRENSCSYLKFELFPLEYIPWSLLPLDYYSDYQLHPSHSQLVHVSSLSLSPAPPPLSSFYLPPMIRIPPFISTLPSFPTQSCHPFHPSSLSS